MSLPGTDASSSSLLLAKCGSTLFCFGRSAFLWLAVIAVFLFGALRSRISSLARRAPEDGKKKT